MIDSTAMRPMATLDEARERRRATLEPWRCEGHLRDGRTCSKLLMELDKERPSYIRKACERCGHMNIFVEAYRA